MMNVFQLAGNDQSIDYLGQIFGNVGIALAGTGPTLLPSMFKVFNNALLVVGTLIVIYVTIMGVLKTAQEGEFMGKHWSSLWVPLRVVGGIASLFPTGSGYCGIQIIFMWVIVQGVGAADMVWKQAVEYFSLGGKVFTASPNLSDLTGALPQSLQTIFSDLVCQAAVVKANAQKADVLARTQFDQTLDPDTQEVISAKYSFGRQVGDATDPARTECGFVNLKGDVDPVTGAAIEGSMTAQVNAMQTIVPVLEMLANQYVNTLILEPTCWNNVVDNAPCHPTPVIPGDPDTCTYFGKYVAFSTSCKWILKENQAEITKKIITYAGSNPMADAVKLFYGYANNYTIQYKLKEQQREEQKQASSPIQSSDAYTTAIANGWIFAGAYYYDIAAKGGQDASRYNSFVTGVRAKLSAQLSQATIPSTGDFSSYWDFMKPVYIAAQTVAAKLENAAAADAAAGGNAGFVVSGAAGDVPASGAGGMSALSGVTNGIASSFMGMLSPNPGQDPLVALHNFGKGLLIAAEVLFWVFFGVGIAIGFGSTNILALGFTLNYFQGISDFLQKFFLPLFFALVGYLISIGGLLGVYMPLLPYMLFTFGALGWFIAVIEAIIAAPLVALGILSPGGQHEILGSSANAMMMLATIFLRPVLMVFGLMAAMLMGIIAVKFINAAFLSVMGSFTETGPGGSSMGLIEIFLFIMAYVGMVITALNKCYAMIHQVPDKCVTWFGGHGISAGEEQAVGEVKGKISAGEQAATKAASAGAGGSMSMGGAKVARGKAGMDEANKLGEEAKAGGGGGGGGGGAGAAGGEEEGAGENQRGEGEEGGEPGEGGGEEGK